MDVISAVVVVGISPFWEGMCKDFILKQLEEVNKNNLFQILWSVLSSCISDSLKTSIPQGLLQNVLYTVDKVDLSFNVFAPLLKYESLSCHVMILIDSRHNQLDSILVLLTYELILILLSINGNCELLRIFVELLSLKVLLEMEVLYSINLFLNFALTIRDVCILDTVLECTLYYIELWLLAMVGDFVQKTLSKSYENHKFFPFFKSSCLVDMVKTSECSG